MEELKAQLNKINLKLENKAIERLWKFKEIVLEKNKVLMAFFYFEPLLNQIMKFDSISFL